MVGLGPTESGRRDPRNPLAPRRPATAARRARLEANRVARLKSGERLTLDIEADDWTVEEGDGGTQQYVTGTARWDATDGGLRQRRKLAWSGGATVTVPWNGKRVGMPVVVTLGVFSDVERGAAEAAVAREVRRDLSGSRSVDDESLRESARLSLRHAIRRRTGTRVVCEARLAGAPAMVESDKV